MIDIDKKIEEGTGGAYIDHDFGVDIKTYSWVPPYLEDKKIRDAIKALKNQSREAMAQPIHRDELRIQFEKQIESINEFRIHQLVEYLKGVQQRDDSNYPMISPLVLFNRKVLGAHFAPYMINLTPEDLDQIFSQLPEGAKQSEIDSSVAANRREIEEFEDMLHCDFNPPDRWWYRTDGSPHAYPKGCRWTMFVKVWEGVACRFQQSVNINGRIFTSEHEQKAYFMLKLDEVPKREPIKKPF